jgi:hypothetical protein
VLEDHLTGVEAVEVSKTHRVSKGITHATPRSQAKARYDLLTYLLTSTVYSHYLLHTQKVAVEDAMFQVDTSETSMEPVAIQETVEDAIESFLANF